MPSVESLPFFSVGYPDRERVEVTLLGSPSDPKSEVYDWLKALVHVEVGAFKGVVGAYICVSDIIRFKEQLEPVFRNLEGVAEFKTIEDQLAIKIEVDKLGHVQVSGFVLDDFVYGNKLNFNIRYDQTLLWHTISEIDEALFELFPRRHKGLAADGAIAVFSSNFFPFSLNADRDWRGPHGELVRNTLNARRVMPSVCLTPSDFPHEVTTRPPKIYS